MVFFAIANNNDFKADVVTNEGNQMMNKGISIDAELTEIQAWMTSLCIQDMKLMTFKTFLHLITPLLQRRMNQRFRRAIHRF